MLTRLIPRSSRRVLAQACRLRSTLTIDLDDEDERTSWASMWPRHGALSCSDDGSCIRQQRGAGITAAALGGATLEEGRWHLTYGVKGDAVVGVAAVPEGDDWQAKAWGVGTATGCLHHSSAIEDGLHGIELMPQRSSVISPNGSSISSSTSTSQRCGCAGTGPGPLDGLAARHSSLD